VRKVLTASLTAPPAALLQNYVSDWHWRKLIVSFLEKRVYYWEPYGGKLDKNHAVWKAYRAAFGALKDGWVFDNVEVKCQTDDCSCGVWDLVGDRAWIAYMDSDAFQMGTFGAFFRSWLRERGVVDLNALRGSGVSRGDATRDNLAFIRQERIELRARLAAAAKAGNLAFTEGLNQGEALRPGTVALTETELDQLDGDE
jgi:hypothetical protein